MTIEAALSGGAQDAGEHVLGDRAAGRPVAATADVAGDHRPTDRVFSAPVGRIGRECKQEREQRLSLAIQVLRWRLRSPRDGRIFVQ